MAAILNAITLPGRQFSIGERRTDSRRSCFQYLLSILRLLPTRSLIQKFVRHEVTKRTSRGILHLDRV